MKIFKDRQAAGQLLARRLKGTKADLVLGIPRGGVVVAYEVAKKLKLSLDIIVTRKIGAPNQQELALGAIDPDGEAVWDEELLHELRVKSEELRDEIKNQWKELKRRENEYRNGKVLTKQPTAVGKSVILVDDGMATGATVLATSRYLKRHGAKVILAVPVASKDSLDKVKSLVDEIVVLATPEAFRTVGEFYQHFEPVTDEEVIALLR